MQWCEAVASNRLYKCFVGLQNIFLPQNKAKKLMERKTSKRLRFLVCLRWALSLCDVILLISFTSFVSFLIQMCSVIVVQLNSHYEVLRYAIVCVKAPWHGSGMED